MVIPEDLVDSVCEKVAQFSDDEGKNEITRLTKLQPALLAFAMASTEDLSKDAQELGLYMFVVIHRMYESHFGKELQNVGIRRVEEIADRNEAEFEGLASADEETLLQSAQSQGAKQPAVMQYIASCIFEPDEDIVLSEEDIGGIMLTMKTIMDCLDSSIRA